MKKPFSQACENNKEPIRQVLHNYLQEPGTLLEIGSGTGQHSAHISNHYPQLRWLTSDCAENIPGIQAWVNESNNSNLCSPIELDINQAAWTANKVNYLYSSNTVHIMSWQEVEKLFQFVPYCLEDGGYFFLYGPFNYNGKFTSPSNEQFNHWLKSQAPHRAIRDFEAINALANEQGLLLKCDHEMPANNRLLVWQL